jgi:hypothetical protein
MKVRIYPLKLVTTPNYSQVKILVRTMSTQISFPPVVQTHSFISCPGGWSQTIPQVKKLDVEVLCWRGCMWSKVVRLVGRTAKFSKTMLAAAYGREMNIQLSSNSSGGHSYSQHANCILPQNMRLLWHCVVWQNCTFWSGLLLSQAQGAPM